MKRKLITILSFVLLFTTLLISCSEAASVVSASINEKGELVLEMSDGTTQNLGEVKGEKGANADGNPLELEFYLLTDDTYAVAWDETRQHEKIVIPEMYYGKPVTKIIHNAFSGMNSLKEVVIPNTIKEIGEGAFRNCSSLTSITIPDSVTSIGGSAFHYCSSLTSVTIPNSVTSIGDYAFSYCSSLTSVTIGNSVTSIGYEAFYDCDSLTSVTIGNSVTSIGERAFSGCSKLTSVNITDIAKWCAIEFGSYASNPLYYAKNLYLNGTLVTNLVIPNGVTSIGNYAFSSCYSITSVTIPDSVTSLGDMAFYNCSSLTSVKYRGTEQQWNNISKGYIGYNGTVTYNYTGE